jgi:hypothetical protein
MDAVTGFVLGEFGFEFFVPPPEGRQQNANTRWLHLPTAVHPYRLTSDKARAV